MANPWESAVILRDKQGAPIPQLWDSSQNKFIPYEGKNKLYGPDGNLISTENPLPVQLSGSNVEIGGVSFAVSGGDTLRNTAANKPNADAAHAAIPFCYYHAIDTGAIEATDGTNWVVI